MKKPISTMVSIVLALFLVVTSGSQPTKAQSKDTTNTQWQFIKQVDKVKDNQSKLSQPPPSSQSTGMCKPSACTPTTVLFRNDFQYDNASYVHACIAYVDVFEDDLLGGNVGSASLIEPLREVPVIGVLIDINPVI